MAVEGEATIALRAVTSVVPTVVRSRVALILVDLLFCALFLAIFPGCTFFLRNL